jgi:6-phosphogluconolactonase (cycloisomerase 2 family)
MKFSKFGRMALALAVSLGTGLGVTSCSTDHTVGYFWVTGAQYNQIGGYRVDFNQGQLTVNPGSPYGSNGVNPIRAVVTTAGKFLYVLNAGCGAAGQAACPAGTPANLAAPNISLFAVGGQGSLSFQQSYTSQGSLPVSILADTTGKYLLVLDSLSPNKANCVSTGGATNCGDITAFNIDQNTGRLSLITNLQVKDANGTNLTYFPIGTGPIEFALYNSSFVYVIEKGSGTAGDPNQGVFVYQFGSSNGQLTLTQNTPLPTGAVNLSYIYASSGYVYLLDTMTPPGATPTSPGQILPYTSGTNGGLQALVGGAVPNTGTTGNPTAMIVDHTNKFVYVANRGPNLTSSSAASTVSAFFINANAAGQLQALSSGAAANNVPFGSGSGPRCILEDPSNQYLYTANFDSGTVTGGVINQQTGTLTNLRKSSVFTTVGQPTWCIASGTLF